MEITSRPPIVFVEGRGSWLRDADGKDYLDFIQGWAVNCLGHCPDVIVKAMAAQSARLLNCSPSFYNAPMIRLADLIARAQRVHRTFFTNSGAEAIEGAIKLARKWGQKHRGGAYEIITMDHGFHGRTLAAMAASGKPQWEQLFEPKVPGFPKVPLNDLAPVERAITPNTAAVMLEPIQGEAGVFVATDEFLRGLRALTQSRRHPAHPRRDPDRHRPHGKILRLRACGHRAGHHGAGKGLGGGIPLGALVAHEDVCCFEHGDQGGTFNGNAFATAVGCAVMEEVGKLGFLQQVAQSGIYLTAHLEALSRKHGCGGVRGRGLLLALDLERDIGPAVAAEVFETRPAYQCAAPGFAALHAGAQRDARGDRPDERRAGQVC